MRDFTEWQGAVDRSCSFFEGSDLVFDFGDVFIVEHCIELYSHLCKIPAKWFELPIHECIDRMESLLWVQPVDLLDVFGECG